VVYFGLRDGPALLSLSGLTSSSRFGNPGRELELPGALTFAPTLREVGVEFPDGVQQQFFGPREI